VGTDGAVERIARTLVAAASDVETPAGGRSAVQSSTALPPAAAVSGMILVSTTCPLAAGERGVFPAVAAVMTAIPATSGDLDALPVTAGIPVAGATPIIGKRSRRANPSGGTLFRWRKYGIVLLNVLANNDAEFTLMVSGSTKPARIRAKFALIEAFKRLVPESDRLSGDRAFVETTNGI
jgi:hypothetical protein